MQHVLAVSSNWRAKKNWRRVKAIEVRLVGGYDCPFFTLAQLDEFMGETTEADDSRTPGKSRTASEVPVVSSQAYRVGRFEDEDKISIEEAIKKARRSKVEDKARTKSFDSIMSMKSWRK
jgi:hypothetical protein